MSTKKRILHIAEAMGGGVFTYLKELTDILADHYEITIAYGVRPQTPDHLDSLFDSRIHLIEVKSFCREINPKSDMQSLREIKKIAEEFHPDIIHLHSSKAGVLGRLAFHNKNEKVFYTPHGYSFLMEDCSKLKRSIYKGIEAGFGLFPCTTISCSPGENREAQKVTKRTAYVNNGIDMKELDRLTENTRVIPHDFTVFTIGRICTQKNPALFNEIATKLPNVRFVWIGDGDLEKELSAPNIEITGWLDRSEVISRAVNADVFMLTSRWEGLPISLLEAMYLQKICIVTDVIGNNDVIHDGINGYLARSADEFVQAIQQVKENDCFDLKEKAKADIQHTYNTQVMAEQYRKIYE